MQLLQRIKALEKLLKKIPCFMWTYNLPRISLACYIRVCCGQCEIFFYQGVNLEVQMGITIANISQAKVDMDDGKIF